MVLVDSSVFINAQRRPDSDDSIELIALLSSGEAVVTGPVIMEYIRGARSVEELDFLTERIVSIECLDVDQRTWVTAGRISNRLIRMGQMLTDLDVVIAATAIRHDVPLYTLDRGFDRIPELRLYQPDLMQVRYSPEPSNNST